MELNASSWRCKQKVAFKYQVLDDGDDVASWDLAVCSLVRKYWHYRSINTRDRSLFMDNLLTLLKWQPCGMCGNILWCHTPEEELTGCLSGEWCPLYCKHVLPITLSNRIGLHSMPQTAVICQKCGHLLAKHYYREWNMGLWLQQNKCHKNGRHCHELSHKETVASPNNNEDSDCFRWCRGSGTPQISSP